MKSISALFFISLTIFAITAHKLANIDETSLFLETKETDLTHKEEFGFCTPTQWPRFLHATKNFAKRILETNRSSQLVELLTSVKKSNCLIRKKDKSDRANKNKDVFRFVFKITDKELVCAFPIAVNKPGQFAFDVDTTENELAKIYCRSASNYNDEDYYTPSGEKINVANNHAGNTVYQETQEDIIGEKQDIDLDTTKSSLEEENNMKEIKFFSNKSLAGGWSACDNNAKLLTITMFESLIMNGHLRRLPISLQNIKECQQQIVAGTNYNVIIEINEDKCELTFHKNLQSILQPLANSYLRHNNVQPCMKLYASKLF